MSLDPDADWRWRRRHRWRSRHRYDDRYDHRHDDRYDHGYDSGRGTVRASMFRRLAIAALVLLVLALSGVSSLVWFITTRLGIHGWHRPGVALVVVLLVALSALRTFRVARHIASPLSAVMEAADKVAEGDYATRVDERGPAPVRDLIRSFNTMTQRLQHADRQRRDLMAELAHELRTPLSVLQGRIEGLLDGIYPLEQAQLEQPLAG